MFVQTLWLSYPQLWWSTNVLLCCRRECLLLTIRFEEHWLPIMRDVWVHHTAIPVEIDMSDQSLCGAPCDARDLSPAIQLWPRTKALERIIEAVSFACIEEVYDGVPLQYAMPEVDGRVEEVILILEPMIVQYTQELITTIAGRKALPRDCCHLRIVTMCHLRTVTMCRQRIVTMC